MIGFEGIRQAYTEGCRQGSAVLRACVEWDLDEDLPPMEQAEDEAIRAYCAAGQANFAEALTHARCACQFERQEYGDCPTWRPLHEAILAAHCARSRSACDSVVTEGDNGHEVVAEASTTVCTAGAV